MWALFSVRLWTNLAWIPMELAVTLVMFRVSVLVLSVETTEVFAIVSQEPRIQTTSFSSVTHPTPHFTVKASARVATGRRPSGTATVA